MTSPENTPETLTIPIPQMAPFGVPLDNGSAIQEIWDTYIKPGQEAGMPQSIEERMLMAVLRSVYKGYVDAGLVDS